MYVPHLQLFILGDGTGDWFGGAVGREERERGGPVGARDFYTPAASLLSSYYYPNFLLLFDGLR